jgi:hypothetical protein
MAGTNDDPPLPPQAATDARARAVLFLAEYWAAHLQRMRRHDDVILTAEEFGLYAQIVMDTVLPSTESENVGASHPIDYHETFRLNPQNIPPPTIADIESTAPIWAPVVPESDYLRAQLAHLLLTKYPVQEHRIPLLRATLDLDSAHIQQAYFALYNTPLANLYSPPPLTFRQRLRRLFGGR